MGLTACDDEARRIRNEKSAVSMKEVQRTTSYRYNRVNYQRESEIS